MFWKKIERAKRIVFWIAGFIIGDSLPDLVFSFALFEYVNQTLSELSGLEKHPLGDLKAQVGDHRVRWPKELWVHSG